MLTRYMLLPVVCLSVLSRGFIEMDVWVELAFGTEATVALFHEVLKRNSGICKIKSTIF